MILYETLYYGAQTIDGDYIKHYRTPGSKNGQRLYQNKDGSLTPLGREHYGVGDARKKGKTEDKKATARSPRDKANPNKPISSAMQKKYNLLEADPSKDQANDNAWDMAYGGASKKEITDYLNENGLDADKWFSDYKKPGGIKESLKRDFDGEEKQHKEKVERESKELYNAMTYHGRGDASPEDIAHGEALESKIYKISNRSSMDKVWKNVNDAQNAYNDRDRQYTKEHPYPKRKHMLGSNKDYQRAMRVYIAKKKQDPELNRLAGEVTKAQHNVASKVLKSMGYEDDEKSRRKILRIIGGDEYRE